ncbi:MAG: adenylate/guanylate cyclase domain-containing protein [Deltaproteobacteria bacterium]|nr:MAG: adenylate/guanylate cyclase domain-containing protein [Deltaproteobacteria bacterium]
MAGAGPSQEALERLIEARLQPGADREAIDRKIWERFGETWAVVFTDLVGFSKRTRDFGIIHFLSVIHQKRRLLAPVVDEYSGLILKQEADSWLVLFRRPEQALECMIEAQRICERYNAGRPEEDRVMLCVGIGYGEMLRIGDHDVWGEEVNYASKLGEDIARHGEILLTPAASDAVEAPALGVGVSRVEKADGFPPVYYKVDYTL